MKVKWKSLIKYGLITGTVLLISRFILFRDNVGTLPVKKVDISARVVSRTVAASGEVKSDKEASLSFNIAGRVSDIAVEEGAVVKQGQYLAKVDTAATLQTIQAAKDARDVAIRDRDIYIENYETNQSAVGGTDEYALQIRRLDELVSKAEATYKATEAGLRNSYINAPFAGIVLDIMKEPGETTTIGETVIKLADLDNLVFEITLDQEDYGLVAEGQQVNIELDSYENETFEGTITKLPQYANGGASPSFTVEINLQQPTEKKILLGMTGDAYIVVGSTQDAAPSLVYDEISFDAEGNPFVWVIRDDSLVKQTIEIGLEGDIYTEILSQIDDDIVVGIDNDTEIKEGIKPKLVK